MLLHTAATASGILWLSACGDPVQPVLQQPQRIDEISFGTNVWWGATPPEGILTLSAYAADPSFRATHETRLRVEVRSSSGDLERISFKKAFCGDDPDHGAWLCNGMTIIMKDGFHVQDLHSRLRSLGGRYTTSPSIGWFAGIELFDVSLEEAIRVASGWPGVKSVERSSVFRTPGSFMEFDEWVGRALRAQAKLDVLPAVSGNGHIEVQDGDTIIFRYTQPDSSIYTRSVLFASGVSGSP